jgi:hypothetical protein
MHHHHHRHQSAKHEGLRDKHHYLQLAPQAAALRDYFCRRTQLCRSTCPIITMLASRHVPPFSATAIVA